MEIKNLKKAAKRIKKAVENKERIVLYGDADLDGVSSLIILKEAVENLNGEVSVVYFPDRENEGYGINKTALRFLKKYSPALFISVDCGVGNIKEVELAKKLGFEVLIVDHHEVLGKLPDASIIVDPKQKGDNYPFKNFAASGVVFKLACLLLGKKLGESLKNNLLELTALATMADMMPEVDENKVFIEKGLNSLVQSYRPGIRAFFELNFKKEYDSSRDFARKIIPILNFGESLKNHLNTTYLLLAVLNEKQAKELILELIERGQKRQIRIQEIFHEAEGRLMKNFKEPIFFEGDASWPLLLAGPVASRMCNRYKKPIFLFKIEKKESVGAVRTPFGLNAVEAMAKCQNLLDTYGGHPPAAGFRLKNKNLDKFKKCLTQYFKDKV